MPLATIVQRLFLDRGVDMRLSAPEFDRLDVKIARDVSSKFRASVTVLGSVPSVVVVHRDADNAGTTARRAEIETAVHMENGGSHLVPVIPVRCTEAWLLLDEQSIRMVAGNPRGRVDLGLPAARHAEQVADPKRLLQDCLLTAAETSGRRHAKARTRFPHHRRQLLERLDVDGSVTQLESWRALVADVDRVARLIANPE